MNALEKRVEALERRLAIAETELLVIYRLIVRPGEHGPEVIAATGRGHQEWRIEREPDETYDGFIERARECAMHRPAICAKL
jgi:hypothetical protein